MSSESKALLRRRRVQGTEYKVQGNQGIKLNNFVTFKSVKICSIRQICVQFVPIFQRGSLSKKNAPETFH